MFGMLTRRLFLGPSLRWSTGTAHAVTTPTAHGIAGRRAESVVDFDWDLVNEEHLTRSAGAKLLHLFGQILDFDGNPMPDTLIEIWHDGPDGAVRYDGRNMSDMGGMGFQGYGAQSSDICGNYRFRTILPTTSSSVPPHINARLTPRRGRVLTTRLYLMDEPRNCDDWHFASLGPSGQAAVTLDPVKRRDEDFEAGFNFVL